MSSNRVERLVNLTICLMSARSYLSLWEIGERVAGYDVGRTEQEQQAFRRMFERDKEALRELGIPLDEGSNTSFRDEVGYRIPPGDYALPEIGFDREELAALALANRLWVSAGLSGAGATALHKLEAVGEETAIPPEDLLPRVESPDAAFEPLRQAVRDRRPVRFPYLKAGAAAAGERRVQPWGVVSWHGHWYLAGHDDDRGQMRVFRLSRIRGPVQAAGPPGSVVRPAGLDIRAEVVRKASQLAEGEGTERVACLRVRAGAAHALRRRARPGADRGGPGAGMPADGAGTPKAATEAAEVIEVAFTDVERMAAQVLWHGPDVVVVGPPDLREHVLGRLRARAAAGAAP
jgi:predicted DNA-binding transcriptional regulator YafY